MKEKYNKKILNVYKISFNIKWEMLFLVTNLKNNKNSRYKDPVSDYCDKEYKLFNYLINYKISNFEDIVYCNVTIKLARSYLKVLYNKFLDMYDLQVNRIYDNYDLKESELINFSNFKYDSYNLSSNCLYESVLYFNFLILLYIVLITYLQYILPTSNIFHLLLNKIIK